MKKTCLVLALVALSGALSGIASPAMAKSSAHTAGTAGACYTPDQMQAEQLIRLHSELMDIMVTCRTDSNGTDLGHEYSDFTQKNRNAIIGAESTMTAYYKSHHGGSEPHDVDRLRTMLANAYAQKAADMSSSAFCGQYRDMVTKFDQSSSADVQNEVQRMIVSDRSYVPSCTNGTAAVQ
jgi:hypothetical protein